MMPQGWGLTSVASLKVVGPNSAFSDTTQLSFTVFVRIERLLSQYNIYIMYFHLSDLKFVLYIISRASSVQRRSHKESVHSPP